MVLNRSLLLGAQLGRHPCIDIEQSRLRVDHLFYDEPADGNFAVLAVLPYLGAGCLHVTGFGIAVWINNEYPTHAHHCRWWNFLLHIIFWLFCADERHELRMALAFLQFIPQARP